MIWINGQEQTQIAVSDRALQYGDGCFTTVAFAQEKLHFWPLHLSRLKDNCARLNIVFNQWQELSDLLQQLVNQNLLTSPCVIKIIITRGTGGRGYSPIDVKNPSYIVSTHDFPSHYKQWQHVGIELTVSSVKLGKQPLLGGIKHLNRLEQVLIKQELAQTRFEDAMVCNSDNEIVESSAGNLFWLQDGQWYTPFVDECGVEGIMRAHVCAVLASKMQPVKEIRVQLNKEFTAQEMFVCNSLMEIVPVNTLFLNEGQQHLKFTCAQVNVLQALVNNDQTKA